MDREQKSGGHRTPRDFVRNFYKVLFTRVITHAPEATGRDILLTAWGRMPLVLAHVDIDAEDGKGGVLSVSEPPGTVRWGDIPTP